MFDCNLDFNIFRRAFPPFPRVFRDRGWGRRENDWVRKYLTSSLLGSEKTLPKMGLVKKKCLSTIIDLAY